MRFAAEAAISTPATADSATIIILCMRFELLGFAFAPCVQDSDPVVGVPKEIVNMHSASDDSSRLFWKSMWKRLGARYVVMRSIGDVVALAV
jgi:hypothetical protein